MRQREIPVSKVQGVLAHNLFRPFPARLLSPVESLAVCPGAQPHRGVDPPHADRVRQLHRRFLEFSNKAWFNLVVHADYGNLIWKKWREVMETEALYAEVRGYLSELGSFLEEERRAWYKSLSSYLVVLGFAVNLIATVFSVGLVRAPSGPVIGWPVFVLVALAIPLVIGGLLWAGQWGFSRRDGSWKLRGSSGGKGRRKIVSPVARVREAIRKGGRNALSTKNRKKNRNPHTRLDG